MVCIVTMRGSDFVEAGNLFITFRRNNGALATMYVAVVHEETGVIRGTVAAGNLSALELHSVGNRIQIRGEPPRRFITSAD